MFLVSIEQPALKHPGDKSKFRSAYNYPKEEDMKEEEQTDVKIIKKKTTDGRI